MLTEAARVLIFLGILLVAAGSILLLMQKSELSSMFHWVGNLPLDFKIEKENFRFYFPVGTSITVSLLLTILLYCFHKFIH